MLTDTQKALIFKGGQLTGFRTLGMKEVLKTEIKKLVRSALRGIKPLSEDYKFKLDFGQGMNKKYYIDVSMQTDDWGSVPMGYIQTPSRDGLQKEGEAIMKQITDRLVDLFQNLGMEDVEAGDYNYDNTNVWFNFPEGEEPARVDTGEFEL